MGQVGITRQTTTGEIYLPKDHTNYKDIDIDSEQYFLRGSYSMSNGYLNTYDAAVRANYSKELGNHILFANFQGSISENSTSNVTTRAVGFVSDDMDYISQAVQYPESGKPSGTESLTRELGLLGAFNYSYSEKYLMDFSYRANASSLFGSDKRWGNFWALGLGWNVHKESLLSDVEFINQLRVRLSTGYSGSQNFKTYQALSTYKYYEDQIYDNIIGAYLLSLANKNLQWQKTKDDNLGIDINLFNKLNVTADFYIKTTDNLLTPVSLPLSTGFNTYTENLGKTRNKGLEFKLNYRVLSISSSQTYLSLQASLAHNKNKLLKISNALSSLNDEKDSDKGSNSNHENDKSGTIKPSIRYVEGQSMSAIWAVPSLGIDPMTGNEIFIKKDGSQTYTWSADDQVVCGDALPKISGTFGFYLEHKGFSLNASFLYNLGGKYYNSTLVEKVENADVQYNVDRRMLYDRWSTPGEAAKYKKFSQSATFTRPTSRFIQNFNELQITSINVGYNFMHTRLIKKLKIQQLKITAYMNDIARFSSVKTERGTEYPYSKTISTSLQITL